MCSEGQSHKCSSVGQGSGLHCFTFRLIVAYHRDQQPTAYGLLPAHRGFGAGPHSGELQWHLVVAGFACTVPQLGSEDLGLCPSLCCSVVRCQEKAAVVAARYKHQPQRWIRGRGGACSGAVAPRPL